jgi:hypothetical protein
MLDAAGAQWVSWEQLSSVSDNKVRHTLLVMDATDVSSTLVQSRLPPTWFARTECSMIGRTTIPTHKLIAASSVRK